MEKNKEKALRDMAELLLSKATMLQYHCDKCKSPLFEKEGKIICPTCGIMQEKEIKKEAEKFIEGLNEMKEKKVCIKTRSDIYRGTCKDVEKDFSFLLKDVERLSVYGSTSEEEWKYVSDLMLIHGNCIEAVWLEKK
ncbi:MAG: Sjogren's syndrome/scleroderma autoantigen 1 family protein [Candidatus Hydrothermarchaeota archaeon]|nr:Sjogren's syndrome/scleroderma autoantigen 1 family protein [Candidatus Hydrothermarchaeota archaeon]